MKNKYKIIITNSKIYREFELPDVNCEKTLGTDSTCDYRIRKDCVFEPLKISFVFDGKQWSVFGSENIYFTNGDSRKLNVLLITDREEYYVKYKISDIEAFKIEFVIDFNNRRIKYERAVNISKVKEIKIGPDAECQIVLNGELAEKEKVELSVYKEHCILKICSSDYRIYHNTVKAENYCIIRKNDFFSIVNYMFYYDGKAIWTEIRDDILIKDIGFSNHIKPEHYPKFRRSTRIKKKSEEHVIEVLDPPEKPQKDETDYALSIVPALSMLFLTVSMYISGKGMAAFGIASGGTAVFSLVYGKYRKNVRFRRNLKEREEKYNGYIEEKVKEIQKRRADEKSYLEKIYPDTESQFKLLEMFSDDLFDRQPTDGNFLTVYLGKGSVEAAAKINYKKSEKIEKNDELENIKEQIAREYFYIEKAPVTCSLKKDSCIGIIAEEKNLFSIIKNMVIDLCTRQYHTDLQMYFIMEKEYQDRISCFRFLPGVINEYNNERNIGYDEKSKNKIFDYLYKELSLRESGKKGTYIAAFFYNSSDIKKHPVYRFIGMSKNLNVSFVFLHEKEAEIPQGCSKLIYLGEKNGKIVASDDENDVVDFEFSKIMDSKIKETVKILSGIYTDEASKDNSFLKNITLFDMLNIIMPEDIDLEKNWHDSEISESIAIPIGASQNKIIVLDIHDSAQGPHGLIAGTTGSGKSELLITLILSAAVRFHPHDIGFVIIDFKGGGTANQLKNLPHLLGVVTNIDGKETKRSLKAINAELRKRQILFAEAEVNHIDKYISKYKTGAVNIPIPHLVLIVDEFAELKAEYPEFMKELISAARIGRSLGVHLILATQKPSGQIDEQIWSNSSFKICFRVQSEQDSNEVLKSPLASKITEPGRAYLKVGNSASLELFQTAYGGASQMAYNTYKKEFTICEVDLSGTRYEVYRRENKEILKREKTQADALAEYIRRHCSQTNIRRLEKIFLPPLKKLIMCPDVKNKKDKMIAIGIYDDPDNQIQTEAYIDAERKNTIIVAAPQYGKTNFLQVIIRSIVSMYTPCEANIYIIDFDSMILKIFEKLKHVGGIVLINEPQKLKNLLIMLIDEIKIRKEKFFSAGSGSFSSYAESGEEKLSHIFLIIDNYHAFRESYPEYEDYLVSIVQNGISAGISVFISNSNVSGVGYKLLSNLSNRIALFCNDRAEYIDLFGKTANIPENTAGRCLVEYDRKIYECQLYLAFEGDKENERIEQMKLFVSNTNKNVKDFYVKKIPYIPSVLNKNELYKMIQDNERESGIPIGLRYSDTKAFYLDLFSECTLTFCGNSNIKIDIIKYVFDYLSTKENIRPIKAVVLDNIDGKYAALKRYDIIKNYTVNIYEAFKVIDEWHKELKIRYENTVRGKTNDREELLLMFIGNDNFAEVISADPDMVKKLSEIITKYGKKNAVFIFSEYDNAEIGYDSPELLKIIKKEKNFIFLDEIKKFKVFNISYESIRENKEKFTAGDAFYINRDYAEKIKLIKI